MIEDSRRQVVSTSERPDLAPLVASWLWTEFWRAGGHSLQQTLEAVQTSVTAPRMPKTFVLLVDGEPVGTASLAESDLEERPDLTPWLAGVFVEPAARGQGLAATLIVAVEDQCRKISIPTLWLYTRRAEKVYLRAGWRTVQTVVHKDKPHALMRRDLGGGG
ncbi:GNAT family N-acetyltransferase [Methylocapsa sp. S129]|uniref:GNAT family N-acetyltransferase n=1 Tax=Methylocapsa sp. S129 TaxID=1641869 RepID=UPI00131B6C22|nr:GNAT family N-acetyltransferase [Methylocapsa sp. S129]